MNVTVLAASDFVRDAAPWAALVAVMVVCLLIDLRFFARGREPTFAEGVRWSLGWLALGLLATIPVLLLGDGDAAVEYVTVYLIERSLSLDNLFVFLLLFAYFAVPAELRPRLLFWGIVAALVLRGLAIAGGTALIEQFHFVIYILAVTLLFLAYRMLRGVDEDKDPGDSMIVRGVRRLFPVTDDYHGRHWFVHVDGKRATTPLFLALCAMVVADLAFAVDSIPAAFAITLDPVVIWMGNVFALLGLRALFVLVEGLIRRFRYLDETIAIVLAFVAVKLLIEELVVIGPILSLAIVALCFVVGIVASIVADRRDPDSERKRDEREERLEQTSGREADSGEDEASKAPEPARDASG